MTKTDKTMKKEYVVPKTAVVHVGVVRPLAYSGSEQQSLRFYSEPTNEIESEEDFL